MISSPDATTLEIVQVALAVLAIAIAVIAWRWILTRQPDDPALDRLLFLFAPLWWFIRRNRR